MKKMKEGSWSGSRKSLVARYAFDVESDLMVSVVLMDLQR